MQFCFQVFERRSEINTHECTGHFAEIGHDLDKAVTGLEELVMTNLSFWKTGTSAVQRLVFPQHASNAKKYVYGPIAHRDNAYFWRYKALYTNPTDANPSEIDMVTVEDGYRDFGPSPTDQHELGYYSKDAETLSERIMFGLKEVSDQNQKILWRPGKMQSRSKSEKGPKSLEQYQFESREVSRLSILGDEVKHNTNPRKRSRKITQADLKGRTVCYETNIHSMIACDAGGYNVFRRVYSAAIGTGVKTRFPSIANVKNRELNPTSLNKGSIVNCVDVEFNGGDIFLDGAVNVDLFGEARKTNSIHFEFDPVSRSSHTKIRATPIGISTVQDRAVFFEFGLLLQA